MSYIALLGTGTGDSSFHEEEIAFLKKVDLAIYDEKSMKGDCQRAFPWAPSNNPKIQTRVLIHRNAFLV